MDGAESRGQSSESTSLSRSPNRAGSDAASSFQVVPPAISLPKGGGAIRAIGEKFSANPVTGTGSMSVPIATSPGRGGFGPQLALNYDSGAGNGLFGLGWELPLPTITRKTDKGLPRYLDDEESDIFILAGTEDLVPLLDGDGHLPQLIPTRVYGKDYLVRRYRPRIEGLFALIERWVEQSAPANMFWRTISRENVTTWYGRSKDSRIVDPNDATHIFQWFICETHDDKGNVVQYTYKREDATGVAVHSVEESNRDDVQRIANCYPDRILYGNLKPYLPTLDPAGAEWPNPSDGPDQPWMFEVVFDYTDSSSNDVPTTAPTDTSKWHLRADPFSSHRAGFEVRTYRLCRRVLMFHHFEDELGAPDYLVRSTDFEYAEPELGAISDPGRPGYTVLKSVTHCSYQKRAPGDATYESRQLPPVTFTYSEPRVDPVIRTIAPEELENLPVGTEGSGYHWVDLDGEGLSGVLTEQASAWYYKANIGNGRFGPTRVVTNKPAMAALASSRQQFMDLAGDGEIELVDFSGPTPGFQERDTDEGWKRFVPFASLPNIDWSDPNLRFVDLTGDGHADALITEQEVFTWYPSLAEDGFDAAERTRKTFDEDSGPFLVFAGGTQTIFLADMCGDGLSDLVRIRNGEVCYWPNLGYGQFGRKITLGNSPCFDYAGLYDPGRIRLADIDGSGPVDIIYLGRHGAQIYFNRSGNSLSNALTINLPVATTDLPAVQVADLLGNGTACLVWNSHLPADEQSRVRYIDLMGGFAEPAEEHVRHEKPHLLIAIDNNLGGISEIEYTPSTRFYLGDKQGGTAWITRLPFPVHCVSKVTVRDKWRGTAFSSTYSYHHGYFDGVEREFRGFGRVEQVDVEDYGKFLDGNVGSPYITDDHTLYQPPIKTITWYHTGAPLDRRIFGQVEQEYFPKRYASRLPDVVAAPNAFHEKALPDPELSADLSADEWREALRACKGLVLRQEIYELDVKEMAGAVPKHTPVRLYTVTSRNGNVRCLQRRGDNRHAVFLVTDSEVLTYNYELDLRGDAMLQPDPRIGHSLNLRNDEYGNPQQLLAVSYGRWEPGDHTGLPRGDLINQVQSERHIAYSETRYTDDVILTADPDQPSSPIRHHRLRLPREARTYEITGLEPRDPASVYFNVGHLRQHNLCEDGTYPPIAPFGEQAIPLGELEYHEHAADVQPRRRIVEHACTRYFDDASDVRAPADPLPLGQHGPRGLKYEDYKLALTTALLDAVFKEKDLGTGAVIDDKLSWEVMPGVTARAILDDRVDVDSPYLTSGYILGTGIDAVMPPHYWIRSGTAGFGDDAHEHFFLPERYIDPFGNVAKLEYDERDLFVVRGEDAKGNITGIFQDPQGKPRFDFRVLAPLEMVDANGNHSEVALDVPGLVVAGAVKGKFLDGRWQGDHIDGFDFALANPAPSDVVKFCTAQQADRALAEAWLANASSRFVYHLGETLDRAGNPQWGQLMPGACGITRERHASQVALDPRRDNPLHINLECSDGSGNVLMKKVQAEPDPDTGQERWIVNGLTILNNKGKPVKQYEPTFAPGFGCEMPQANGVSATITYYDAVGRTLRVEMADGTFSRVQFSPWLSCSFDANDTVLEPECAWYNNNGRNRFVPSESLPTDVRTGLPATTPDERAGWLAAQHANTPTITIFDSLGRNVISVADLRAADANGEAMYLTYTKLDAEGKPLWIRDARGNLVMQYITPPKVNNDPNDDVPVNAAPRYDIAGNLLSQHSMDAGDRWMITNAAGRSMLVWDFNQTLDDADGGERDERRLFHTRYDALHRPVEQWLRINDDKRALVEAFEYRDTNDLGGRTLVELQGENLIGQPVRHYDPSGLATIERIDFKGAVEEITRRLVKAVDAPIVDWSINGDSAVDWVRAGVALVEAESETFHQITKHDALGRVTTLYNWHRPAQKRVAIYLPTYNQRGLLKSEDLVIRATGYDVATGTRKSAIKDIRYNAKGQKELLQLGNGTVTHYTYDARNFRLLNIRTTRPMVDDNCAEAFIDPTVIQNLQYTYDPVGNITQSKDGAQKTEYGRNQRIDPTNLYEYDALYRLISATGRESGTALGPPRQTKTWPVIDGCPAPDPSLLRNYTESYQYDSVGNFVQMRHDAGPGTWVRDYAYAFDHRAQPASNRLWKTTTDGNTTSYRHDVHGSMLNVANTAPGSDMRWDWRDMIRYVDLGGGGNGYYNYAIDKQRTRKRLVRNPVVSGGTIKEDRIYLGGYELYRRYSGDPDDPIEEIESHHLFEDGQRVLLVDDVLHAKAPQPGPSGLQIKNQTLFRYQYGNGLRSVGIEMDHAAKMISYEEFHPYGTTAYRLMNSKMEIPAKRHGYAGMERDEESGLCNHGARYLCTMLGRWASCDPSFDGINAFSYADGRPTVLVDIDGNRPATPEELRILAYLDDVETRALIEYSKLNPGRQALEELIGGYSNQAERARFTRQSLLAAIGRAGNDEAIKMVRGDFKQAYFVTAGEQHRAEELEVGSQLAYSPLSALGFLGAQAAGGSVKTQNALASLGAAVWDVVIGVGVGTEVHQARKADATSAFPREMQHGAPLVEEGVRGEYTPTSYPTAELPVWPTLKGVPIKPTGRGTVYTGKSARAIPDPMVIGKGGFKTTGTDLDLAGHKLGEGASAFQGATEQLLAPDKETGAARHAVEIDEPRGWVFKLSTEWWDVNQMLYGRWKPSPLLGPEWNEAPFAREAELTISGNIPGYLIEGWFEVELKDGNIKVGPFIPNPYFKR
jgi:RHS repeat-associated protein